MICEASLVQKVVQVLAWLMNIYVKRNGSCKLLCVRIQVQAQQKKYSLIKVNKVIITPQSPSRLLKALQQF